MSPWDNSKNNLLCYPFQKKYSEDNPWLTTGEGTLTVLLLVDKLLLVCRIH